MKMTKTLTAAVIFSAISLSAGLVAANTLPTGGSIPFATWDADGNGTIDEQEFTATRAQRQAAAKAHNRLERNMATAPTFAQIDRDNDGQITAEELTAVQQGQWNKKSMGRGHHGAADCGMKKNTGSRYQAMDAETKEKHDAFVAATTELRKEIATKRAEKRAVMHSADPDPEQAAQLTRELLELRSQMMAQADEAGLDFGPGQGCGNCQGSKGRGGKGHGCGSRR